MDDPPIFRELAGVASGHDRPAESGSAWFGAPVRGPEPADRVPARTSGDPADHCGNGAAPVAANGAPPAAANGSAPARTNGLGAAPVGGAAPGPARRLPVRAPGLWLLAEFARDVLSDHLLTGDDCACGLPAAECGVIRRAYQYDLITQEPHRDGGYPEEC